MTSFNHGSSSGETLLLLCWHDSKLVQIIQVPGICCSGLFGTHTRIPPSSHQHSSQTQECYIPPTQQHSIPPKHSTAAAALPSLQGTATHVCQMRLHRPQDVLINCLMSSRHTHQLLFIISFRSAAAFSVSAGLMLKASTSCFTASGVRKAGRRGPRRTFFTPRDSRVSSTATAFCSNLQRGNSGGGQMHEKSSKQAGRQMGGHVNKTTQSVSANRLSSPKHVSPIAGVHHLQVSSGFSVAGGAASMHSLQKPNVCDVPAMQPYQEAVPPATTASHY